MAVNYSRWPLPVADPKRLRLAVVRTFTAQGGSTQTANAVAQDLFFATMSKLFVTAVKLVPGRAEGDAYILTSSVSLLSGRASATPILTASISLIAGAATQYYPLAGALVFTDAITADDIYDAMLDSLVMSDSTLYIDIPTLIEYIAFNGTVEGFQLSTNTLSDGVTFADTLQVAWSMLLASGLNVTDTSVDYLTKIEALADVLVATGQADSYLTAVEALAAALALDSLIQNGYGAEVLDSVVFTDALTAALALLSVLVDSAAFADSTLNELRITAIANDGLSIITTPTSLLQALETLSDGVAVYATLRLGTADFAGWVMNTDNTAVSEYRNFPFESLATWRGLAYGAGAGGIYRLAGADDDGDAITSSIKTGLMDFGTGKAKKVPDVYIGRTGTGTLVLKVVTTSATGTKIEDWYQQNPDARSGESRGGRIEIGRGLESRYWQFELVSVSGLDISELALRPVVLDRRR